MNALFDSSKNKTNLNWTYPPARKLVTYPVSTTRNRVVSNSDPVNFISGFHMLFQRFCNRKIKCLNKQATVDDDPTGIRWINSDLIGLKHKMKNIKKQRPIQRRKILSLVYYISAGQTRLLQVQWEFTLEVLKLRTLPYKHYCYARKIHHTTCLSSPAYLPQRILWIQSFISRRILFFRPRLNILIFVPS